MTEAIEFHNGIEIHTIQVQLRLRDFCLSHFTLYHVLNINIGSKLIS